MKSVPIATFNERAPAERLKELFRQADVPAVIHDESKLERFWFMSEKLAAIHVRVPQGEYLNAKRLMEQWNHAGDLIAAAVHCPECGSSRIEFPQVTRKALTPALGQTLLMLLHVLPREYYCMDCHCTWPKKAPTEPELDVLNWPVKSKFWHPENPPRSEK